MRQSVLLAVAAPLAVTGVLVAGGLPRPLNFENQTSTRIVPRLAEDSNNEKEVEFGDVDNDGDLDIVVAVGSSDFGARRNKLYINDGGVFTEVSGLSIIPEFAQSDVSRNAFLRDLNNDGWLDIYIINDSNSGGFAGEDKMYLALHKGGVLTGYSEEGSTRIPNGGDLGAACGGVSYDFDGDGDLDVYSGNYPGPSQDRGLYNDGSAVLLDVTSSMIPSDSDYTVDVALADMNGDGKMDLLISNDGDPNFIYYNDNGKGSSGLGDYRYAGSTQNLGSAGARENSMEAADFDNDGDLDIYWSNRTGGSGDRILENIGNDSNNKAILSTINVLPSSVTNSPSRKASVADFNDDGRIDVYVATASGSRPAVLRNTTVNGDISFVDWSPADTFQNNSSLRGWHAAVFDTNGDGDIDILVGAFSGDHLIESVPPTEVDEDDLGAADLPALWNGDPVAVTGRARKGEQDTYTAGDIGSGFVSVVLNGPDDYRLEILNASDVVLATSDRGGAGVEEALQLNTTAGVRKFRITILESVCGPPDFDGDCDVDFEDLLRLLTVWGCTDCPEDIDGGGAGFSDLLIVLQNWGKLDRLNDYLLEVLGRSG